MKAMRLVGASPRPILAEHELPIPEAQPDEVVVQVHAVAITPTELQWVPTLRTKDGHPRSAPVLGHEFSGEIVACGERVIDFSIGQSVFGLNDWFAEGALAEYCATRPEWIAAKPQRLSHEEAASVPISALTAWQGLLERGRLQPDERVLIHGGAGAVGMFAVQIARHAGARVIATASGRDTEFVKLLGADEVVDYRSARFENRVSDVDLVFDTVGGDTLRRSWQVLKPRGRAVTVAVDSEVSTDTRVQAAFFIVEPNGKQLAEVGHLLEAGHLRTKIDLIIPMSAAEAAYAGTIARRGPGKVVASTYEWRQSRAFGSYAEVSCRS